MKGIHRMLQICVVVIWMAITCIAAGHTYQAFVSARAHDREDSLPADMRIESTPENGYYEGPVHRTPPSLSVIKQDAD